MTTLRSLFLVSLFLCALLIGLAGGAELPEEKTLLVIHSYHPGMFWVADINSGISEVFARSDPQVQIRTEYMDTKRYDSPEYFDYLADIYRFKYLHDPPDCIIIVDDAALRFIITERDDLFPGIPIVFCGINHYDAHLVGGETDITGIFENLNIHDTLVMIRSLQPDMQRLVVINEESITGEQMAGTFREVVPSVLPNTPIEYIEGETLSVIGDRVSELGPGDIILLLAVTSEPGSSAFIPHDEVGSFIASHTTVPVYGVFEYYLGDGVVGGVFSPGVDQGRITAEMASRILSGEDADDIPLVLNAETKGVADYRALVSHGIDIGDLLPGTEVLHAPETSFKLPLYVLVILLIVCFSLIIFLIMKDAELSRQKAMEDVLREREEMYRGITERSFDPIITLDSEGRIEYLSPSFVRVTGTPISSCIGLSFLDKIVHEDRERVSSMISSVFNGECVENLHISILKCDGSRISMEATLFPIRRGGRVVGLQGVLRDITERIALLSQQKKAFLQIEANITQLATLGDHIRNPLQVIEGYISIEDGEFRGEISDQIDRINEIITAVDRGWVESENVRAFLKRHYEIGSDREDEKN